MTSAQIQKALLLAILGVVYGAILILFPDFPIPKDLFNLLIIWVLAQFGVEVVEARVVGFFHRRGLLRK